MADEIEILKGLIVGELVIRDNVYNFKPDEKINL